METKKTRGSERTRDSPCSRSSSSDRPSGGPRKAWAHPSSGTCASCGRCGCSGSSGESWLSRPGNHEVKSLSPLPSRSRSLSVWTLDYMLHVETREDERGKGNRGSFGTRWMVGFVIKVRIDFFSYLPKWGWNFDRIAELPLFK